MSFLRRFVVVGAALAVGVGIASCGSSSSSPEDASTDGAIAEGAVTGDAGAGCPAAIPSDGTPCARVPLQCEYGSVDWSDCNSMATCQTTGWSVAPPPAGPICAPNNTSCPSSAAEIVHGGACDHAGLECFFRESTCWCDPGAGADADAGATWACDDPAPGCPTTRPLLGTPCTEDGQVCDYGACALHNIEERCTGGVWSFVFTTCDGG